jgi:hypothetical protein
MQSPFSYLRLIGLAAVFVVGPVSLHAQDDSDADWNHFGLNFRAAFNVRTKFSAPSTGSAFPPGPGAGLALNHEYNDGFVNVDSSGNLGGQTWNWGYQHPSQISGGDVLMHATGGGAGGSESTTDNPDPGFDLSYVHDLAHDSWGQWGIKFGVGYTPILVRDQDPIAANAEMITDKYPLNGVTAPLSPYTGSFGGPGPVLGSEPISRTFSETPGGGMIAGDHDLNAALFDLRLGPSFNIPFCHKLSLQTGGGLAVGLVRSHFTFTESSAGAAPVSGSNTRTGVLPGAYAEIGFAYRVGRSASLFTGAQFEYLGDFNQSVDGRSAQLDLGATIFYELGLQWHF